MWLLSSMIFQHFYKAFGSNWSFCISDKGESRDIFPLLCWSPFHWNRSLNSWVWRSFQKLDWWRRRWRNHPCSSERTLVRSCQHWWCRSHQWRESPALLRVSPSISGKVQLAFPLQWNQRILKMKHEFIKYDENKLTKIFKFWNVQFDILSFTLLEDLECVLQG